MIKLQVPRETVRIFEIFRCRIKKKARPVDGCDAVVCEGCYQKTLVLLEGADVEWNLVVKETHTAAYDCAIRIRGRDGEAQAWGEIVVVPDAVTIVTQSEIEYETRIHDPLV